LTLSLDTNLLKFKIMNFKQVNGIALILLLGFIIMLSACNKEKDSVTITETEEPVELGFKMVVNGTDIETNAVAAYCENDTTDFLIISNKEEHLVFPINSWAFEEGDFAYIKSMSYGTTWSWGGQTFGQDVTGLTDILLYTVFTDADIEIESNDGEIVIGSSQGEFIILDIETQQIVATLPYQMDFVAEIVQESDFCE